MNNNIIMDNIKSVVYESSKLYANLIDFDNIVQNNANDFNNSMKLEFDKMLSDRYNMTPDEMYYFLTNYEKISFDYENIVKYFDIVSFCMYDAQDFTNYIVKNYIIDKQQFGELINVFGCVQNAIELMCANDEFGILDDALITYLARYFIIKKLDASHNDKITDVGLKSLLDLEELNAHCSDKITDDGVMHMIMLLRLDASNMNGISDKSIKRMKLLRFLNIAFNENVTDDGIELNLDIIDLNVCGNTKITDKGIIHLHNLEKLYTGCYIPDKNLLCKYCGEDYFITPKIKMSKITNEGIMRLSKLHTLSINDYITGEGIRDMGNHLRVLYVHGNDNIKDDDLKNLDLVELFMSYNHNITDNGIEHLVNLECLDISNSYITDYGLRNMHKMCRLIISDDADENSGMLITNNGLKQMTQLRVFKIAYSNEVQVNTITDDCINCLTQLEELEILGGKTTDNGIKNLNSLKKLKIVGTKITDEGIKNKINLIELEICYNNMITDIGLKNLKLQKLLLRGVNITDDGIKHLPLKELYSYNTHITCQLANDYSSNARAICHESTHASCGTLSKAKSLFSVDKFSKLEICDENGRIEIKKGMLKKYMKIKCKQ